MRELPRLVHTDEPMQRRLAAIAFLDVVGYSSLMGADDEATLHAWSALRREVIEPQVRTWRGRVVNVAGDGIFVEFRSALGAFRWAVEVQRASQARYRPDSPFRCRVALHLGDVIDGPGGEVHGDGVNTASRLQAYAEPGGVVVSQAIANEVVGRTDALFSDPEVLPFCDIWGPLHTYQLVSPNGVARCDCETWGDSLEHSASVARPGASACNERF